jgi:hypothetical protein
LVGFTAMGHSYAEIFWNFNKRVFTWIYDLFDHKIVPNLPGNPPSNPTSWFSNKLESQKSGWFSGPYSNIKPEVLNNTGIDSLRKTYMDDLINKSVNININSTPWYKDLTTWLLIGGTLASVGVFYIGYKIIMDPLFINDLPLIGNWFRSPIPPVAPEVVVTPTQETVTAANQVAEASSSSVTKSLITTVGNSFKKLNPATWFMSSVDYDNATAVFRASQSSHGYNNSLYLFKPINPYDPWLTRMRISLLGETTLERETRRAIRNEIWANLMPALNVSTPIIPSPSLS